MRFSAHMAVLQSIPLERPFKLFGRTFAVRLSSQLTVEPNTLFWVLTGETFQQAAVQAGSNVFRTLYRGLVKNQRLSKTTLAPVRQLLQSVLPPDLPGEASLVELLDAVPKESAWALFQRGFGEHEGEGLCALARHMSRLEAMLADVVVLKDAGRAAEAEVRFTEHMGVNWEFWAPHLPNPWVYLPLDGLCQGLVALEISRRKPAASIGGALALLDPAKRPLGHWLHLQQKRGGTRSLQALADHTQVADYERLRAWSAGRDLLPPAKAEALLEALGGADTGLEMIRYRWARLVSFLCEWVICATPSRAPTWPAAQMLVAQRYRELLDLAVSRGAGRNQSSSLLPP